MVQIKIKLLSSLQRLSNWYSADYEFFLFAIFAIIFRA